MCSWLLAGAAVHVALTRRCACHCPCNVKLSQFGMLHHMLCTMLVSFLPLGLARHSSVQALLQVAALCEHALHKPTVQVALHFLLHLSSTWL